MRAILGVAGAVLLVTDYLFGMFGEDASPEGSLLLVCLLLGIASYNMGMWIVSLVLKYRKPHRALPPRRLLWCVTGLAIISLPIFFLLAAEANIPSKGADDFSGLGPIFAQLVYAVLAPAIAAAMTVGILLERKNKRAL